MFINMDKVNKVHLFGVEILWTTLVTDKREGQKNSSTQFEPKQNKTLGGKVNIITSLFAQGSKHNT